jgi:uncharacterized protein with NRDE domain
VRSPQRCVALPETHACAWQHAADAAPPGRPSEPVHWWPQDGDGDVSPCDASSDGAAALADGILAGRDCVGLGTWFGLRPALGRWAVLTNFREPLPDCPRPSRGLLPLRFLRDASPDASPEDHLQRLAPAAGTYSGFNLLCGDTRTGAVAVLSSREGAPQPHAVSPGVHALSNGVWGDAWPKVARGRAVLAEVLAQHWPPGAPPPVEVLLTRLLGDCSCDAPDEALPRTFVTRAEERALAPAFVAMDDLRGGGRCVPAAVAATCMRLRADALSALECSRRCAANAGMGRARAWC